MDSLPVTYSPDPPINVGTVTATANFVGSDGNTITGSANYDIVAAQAHVSVTCPTVSYTGASQQVCTAVVTGPLLSQNVPVTYSGDTTNAGTYTASATWAPTSNNYLGDTNTATGTITKATGTVTLTCSAGPFPILAQPQTPCSSAQAVYTDNPNVDVTSYNNLQRQYQRRGGHRQRQLCRRLQPCQKLRVVSLHDRTSRCKLYRHRLCSKL